MASTTSSINTTLLACIVTSPSSINSLTRRRRLPKLNFFPAQCSSSSSVSAQTGPIQLRLSSGLPSFRSWRLSKVKATGSEGLDDNSKDADVQNGFEDNESKEESNNNHKSAGKMSIGNENNNGSGTTTTPLLEAAVYQGQGNRTWWLDRVIDRKEAKEQILYSLPLVLTNVFYYLIPLVSVMFAGHLGQLQLAGSTLANSWANVTGFAFMMGLSGALETLCGQGFGAKRYRMLGIYLQASCIISILFAIIISIIWWYTEPILILLQQSPEIAKEAAIFLRWLIPGIFAYGTIQNILRYLQTQSVVWSTVVCSGVPMLFHFPLTYLLVNCSPLGYSGSALAASLTLWVSAIMLFLYVFYSKDFAQTWSGFSTESFHHIFANLKFALPSAAMVCLEYWAFEILVLLAGLFPNSEITTSLTAMCVNTEAVVYNFIYGLSAAASTRVSNELGAGRVNSAKHAMGVTLKLSVVMTAIILLCLGFGHDIWAGFFSDSTDIKQAFAIITPLVCVSLFFDSIQGILSAVCRGCGWQQFAMYINFGTFYFIGMPIACLLAFKLDLYVKGLWIGLICGLAAQNTCLFLMTQLRSWTTVGLSSDGWQNPASV